MQWIYSETSWHHESRIRIRIFGIRRKRFESESESEYSLQHWSGPRSQEPRLTWSWLLAPAEVTLGHLSSCNDGDPTSKNKYISQQLKWAYYHILIITICWLMNLSEPRDGGSSSSCLVVWADDGSLAISLFFSLYFPTFRQNYWKWFLHHILFNYH